MEPVSTCKLFGAVRAAAAMKNTLPVIHGPRGCGYHIRYLLTARGGKRIRIASTELVEEDVVFGASDKLRRTLINADETHHPDLMVVMSSCATSIIGEDIRRVAEESAGDLGSEVITVSAGGFESTQGEGYEEVMTALIEKFCLEGEPSREPGVNIIGEFRGGPDLRHITGSLEMMGVSVNCVLTAGCTLDDVRRIPSAHLNLSFCDVSGIGPCRLLEEKFGIPFHHHPFPTGLSNSREFYAGILRYFSIDYPLEEVYHDFMDALMDRAAELKGLRAAIVSGPTRAVALAGLLSELGMEVALVSMDMIGDYTLENLGRVPGFRSRVLVGTDVSDIEDALRDAEPDVIVGGLAETCLSEGLRVPLVDVMHGSVLTAGFQGALNVADKIRDAVSCSMG